MADPREFVLIGSFKDGITPELQKINNELGKLKANFAGVGSRKNTGFRGATREIGKLVSAHKTLSTSIKNVQSDLRTTLGVLQQYRREMGKAAAATRAFQKASGSLGSRQFSQNMDAAQRSAQAYLRTLKQINSESRRMPRGGGSFQPPRPPRGGYSGGGGGGRMRPPTPPRGGSGGGGGGMQAHMGEFGFAFTLGSSIAQPIQNAITQGFAIGIGMMTKPFQYFGNAFGERVQDQISDLKAAGGLFAISKRSDTPFLKTIDEAIQYQQDTNQVFAKMAASLPGVTNDYVQVGKRLSDTMGRIAAGDFQNALQEANRIRATEEGRKFYGATITGTGPEATKEVLTTLLGEMTKKTTLAGMGGRSGAGGVAGAYGLPGLAERMLSQQEVSMGQFQRYAAVFSDPTIQDALSRNVDLVNSTLPNTTARFKAMQKLLDEVVTPELIEKLRTSVDGIYQGLRASILDPDTGLFGLGRQFENFGYKLNQYGEYVVDKEGKRIKDSLSIFEIVADIFSNAGQALLPIVDALPLIFDPLKKVANILLDARHYAAEFNRTFNMYREGLKALSETGGKDFLKDTLDIRASLSAVSNLLYQFGAIGKGEFESIGKMLLSENLDIGALLKKLLDSVLNSKIAEEIGNTIGEIIGTVLSEVAGVTGFLSGRIASSNKLFTGLKKGFEDAGGAEAFKNIFKDVFLSLLKVLGELLRIMPVEALFLAGLSVIAPALVQGLAMSFASRVWSGVEGMVGKLGEMITRQISNQASRFTRVKPVNVTDLGSTITDPSRMLPPAKETALATIPKAGPLAKGMSGFASFFMKFGNYIKGVGPRFMGFFKGLLGKLSLFGAALTSVFALFEGKDLARALAEGAGPLLGAALGAALIPFLGPIGPMIGSFLGAELGRMEGVVRPLEEAFRAIGGTIGPSFRALWDALGSAVNTVKSLLMALVGPFIRLDGSVSDATATVIALKIALTPVVAAFQLLEQVVNVCASGIKGLEMAVAYARRGLSTLNPFADKGKQAELDAYIARLGTEQQALNENFYKSFGRHKEYYNTQPVITGGASSTTPTAQDMSWYAQQMAKQPATSNWKGGLGSAIASEMKNKPSGSHLVVANSSETVIPAAGGYGMKDFMSILSAGFTTINNQYKSLASGVNILEQNTDNKFQQAENTSADRYQKITSTIDNYHKENQKEFSKINENVLQLSQKVASMSSMGGMFGGGGGMDLGSGYGGAGVQIAGQLGNFIKQTGGAPGSIHEHPAHGGVKGKHAPGSYHYSGRAIDIGAYANEQAGVIARIKQFNAKMGVKPVEFLHAGNDPNHQDHVHVAYALGKGNPAFFSSQRAAENWEASMAGRMNVRSVTGNTMEGFGGNSVGDIYVTVNAGSVSDPDQLAYMVAERIQAAVGDAVNANIFV